VLFGCGLPRLVFLKIATEHRYEILDGMRGIAAILVMIGHTSFYSGQLLLPNSYIAVDLFFILSGFVLAYSYGDKGMSLGPFMARRFIRLYPMFLAGLTLGAIVLIIATRHGLSTLTTKAAIAGTVLNAFYVPFLNQGSYYDGSGLALQGEIFAANPPYWSLFFEVAVNLFFLNMVGLKQKALTILSGLFLVLILVFAFFSGLISGKGGFNLEGGWNSLDLVGGFPRVFYGFCLGILLFKLSGKHWVVSAGNTLRRIPGSVFILLAVTALLFALPRLFSHTNAIYYLIAVGLVAPALVLLGSKLRCQNPIMLRTVQFLGWLSYPLYCVHYPIIRAVNLLQPKYPLSDISSIIVSCLLSVCAAAILTLVFDQPLRNWLKRFLKKPSGTVPLSAAPTCGH